MEKLIFILLDSGGTELVKYEQEIVTPEIAGYALSQAIEAVKIALVAEGEQPQISALFLSASHPDQSPGTRTPGCTV